MGWKKRVSHNRRREDGGSSGLWQHDVTHLMARLRAQRLTDVKGVVRAHLQLQEVVRRLLQHGNHCRLGRLHLAHKVVLQAVEMLAHLGQLLLAAQKVLLQLLEVARLPLGHPRAFPLGARGVHLGLRRSRLAAMRVEVQPCELELLDAASGHLRTLRGRLQP